MVSGGQSQGCFLAVGPDHSVYVAYFRGNSAEPALHPPLDGRGVSFGTEHTVGNAEPRARPTEASTSAAAVRTNSFPHMAVNPVSGAVVAVCNDDNVRRDGDNGNIFYAESTDNGVTWSSPVKVNDDGPRDQFTPTVAISPTGEQVAFGYYSRSHDPANQMFHRRIRMATMNTTTGAIAMRPSAQISPDTPVVIGQDPVDQLGPIWATTTRSSATNAKLLQHVVRQSGRGLVPYVPARCAGSRAWRATRRTPQRTSA